MARRVDDKRAVRCKSYAVGWTDQSFFDESGKHTVRARPGDEDTTGNGKRVHHRDGDTQRTAVCDPVAPASLLLCGRKQQWRIELRYGPVLDTGRALASHVGVQRTEPEATAIVVDDSQIVDLRPQFQQRPDAFCLSDDILATLVDEKHVCDCRIGGQ